MKLIFSRWFSLACAAALLTSAGLFAAAPQSVSITAPTNNSTQAVTSPSPTVTITATAVASAGGAAISSIDFRVNGTSIGTLVGGSNTVTLSLPWSPTAAGTYTLTAIASDSSSATGNTLTSTPVTVTISPLRLATLVAPANNASVPQNSQIFLRSTATMSDGVVSKVDFLMGPNAGAAVVIGTATSPPFNQAVTISNAPGTYVLFARATASDGTTQFSSAVSSLFVSTAIGAGPTVTLTAPTSSDIVSVGNSVTVSATASDSDGFIPNTNPGGVTFYADGEPIATDLSAPYSAAWTPGVAKSVSLQAQATDDRGNTRLSAPVSVNVLAAFVAPAVSLLSANPVTVNSSTTLTANVTVGSAPIAQVQFLSGSSTVLGTVSSAPYTFSWTPTTTGNVSLTARVTDTNGTVVTSSAVSVTVSSVAPPVVSISTPAPAATVSVGSPVTVTANASGGASINRVDFFLNGSTTPLGTVLTPPYSITWTPSTSGVAALTARATDSNGNSATSPAVNVIVSGPAVAITAPASSALLALNNSTVLSANATAAGSATVVKVDFFAGTTLVGTATSAPFNVVWTPTTAGAVSLTARVTDSNGSTATSTSVPVTVATDPSQMTLALTLSPGFTTVPVGATRNILATVTPVQGRAVTRVEFFVDGVKVGEKTSAPFNYRYRPTFTGTFAFTARATDNGGATREAALTLTVVDAVGAVPSAALISPINNSTVAPNAPLSLIATASAPGGTLAAVQFYVNGAAQGNALTAPPYSVSFTPSNPGGYTVDLIAMDDRGNSTASNASFVIASFGAPTVAVTSPSTTGTVRATPGVPLTVTATAAGGNGAAILLAELLVDGNQVAVRTTPTTTNGSTYSFTWTPTTANLGTHTLTVRATDANSTTNVSGPVTVNVANVVGTPPTISITAPANNATVQSLSTVNFVANAFASGTGNSLSGVEFFLNDASIGPGSREQATNVYRLAYDFGGYNFSGLTQDAQGRYALTLYAIARDTNNNQTLSTTFNLLVTPSTSFAPTVQIVPLGTSVIAGTLFSLGAITSDPDGTVAQVQLFANGVAAAPPVNNPQPGVPLSYTPTVAGRVNLYAVATDDTGNTAISNVVLLTVTANTPPSSVLVRPSDDTTTATVGSPVFLDATASDIDSGQTVTVVFVNASSGQTFATGQRVGTTDTYRALWTPTAAGTFNVAARATDSTGAATVSTISRRVVVTTLAGLAPTITLNAPTNGSTFSTASTGNFTATATDSDGSVASVEFFLNRNSIGQAVRDQVTNTWRLTASFASVPVGNNVEVIALARDSSGNVAGSGTNTINVVASSSLAPTIAIAASTTSVAFSRQVQLTAAVRDIDGTVTNVQYFSNGASIGNSGNAGTSYQINWTPNQSGTFNVWALATDNTGNTTVSAAIQVAVRPNSPVLDDDAFILQTYTDIANTTVPNALVFANLSSQFASGALTRAQFVSNLTAETGFAPPVNLLAAYYAIMGQWPTPANYQTLLGTARNSLPNAIGAILSSPEYVAKFGPTPTAAGFNASFATLSTFATRLWQNAGLGGPSTLQVFQFQNNDLAIPTLGRGYVAAGLNTAIAEFITNTNSPNVTFLKRARAAALYYQLDKPPVLTSTDDIATRVNALAQLADLTAIAGAVLQDQLYLYRYVTITSQPQSLTVAPGANAVFTVDALGAPPLGFQWFFNGAPIAGATTRTLTVTAVNATKTGAYTVNVSTAAGSVTSQVAILGLTTGAKVTGESVEVLRDAVAANQNTYDQVLLKGSAETITADAGQITRISFVDLNDDIVQVEFSGAGTLAVLLDAASGPAAPVNYRQPGVTYMKGHAGIVVTDADETTNLSVFSVGRLTATNSALFDDAVTYDGVADIAYIAILSANGRFGGLRTANASYWATKGDTGIFAPGVEFSGPVYLGDIEARAEATPVLLLGSASDVRIAGGSLQQLNNRSLQVSGIEQLRFTSGTTANGTTLPAQTNQARFEQNGVDVTTELTTAINR